jgi:hypothetical protein
MYIPADRGYGTSKPKQTTPVQWGTMEGRPPTGTALRQREEGPYLSFRMVLNLS